MTNICAFSFFQFELPWIQEVANEKKKSGDNTDALTNWEPSAFFKHYRVYHKNISKCRSLSYLWKTSSSINTSFLKCLPLFTNWRLFDFTAPESSALRILAIRLLACSPWHIDENKIVLYILTSGWKNNFSLLRETFRLHYCNKKVFRYKSSDRQNYYKSSQEHITKPTQIFTIQHLTSFE